MWRKMKQNPNRLHFMAYCFSFLGYGAILTGLGPLIPYLSQQQNVLQTAYSYLFLNRAIGFVLGSLLVKLLQKRMTFHHILIIFSTLIFACFSLFSLSSSMFMQGFYVLLGSIFCATTEIILNVSLLTAHQGEDQQFYMQIGHGMFGVGGLVSPLIVVYFQTNTYIVLGAIMFVVVPAYFLLTTPELNKSTFANEIIEAGNIADQIIRLSKRQSISFTNKFQQKKRTIIYLISFMFFIYIGQQVAYGGWISSYAVLQKVSTKQQATRFSSIFWLFMTIFRFILAFIKMGPSQKIKILIWSQLSISLSTLMLTQVLELHLFASYFASICYGISLSAIFGLLFVFPYEYNIDVTCQEGSSFLMYGELGEGTISMVVGYLMGWVKPELLFYAMMICGLALAWALRKVILVMQSQKHQDMVHQQMVQISSQQHDSSKLKIPLINKYP